MRYFPFFSRHREPSTEEVILQALSLVECNVMTKLDELKTLFDAESAEIHDGVTKATALMQEVRDVLKSHQADDTVIQGLIDSAKASKAELEGPFVDAINALDAMLHPPAPTP